MELGILELFGNQFEHVDNQRKKLFEVVRHQLHAPDSKFNAPDAYGLYRSTGGNALGVVGRNFYYNQPEVVFDAFVNSLVEINADLSELTVTELKGGSKLMFSAPIKTYSYKNLVGKDDEMIMRANVMIGFDGRTKSTAFIDCYRMICSNLNKAWRTEFELSFKNTYGNKDKPTYVLNDMVKILDMEKDYEEFTKAISKKNFTGAEYRKFIDTILKVDRKKEIATRTQTLIDKLETAITQEINDCGANAWALLNGVTRHVTHNVKDNRSDMLDFVYTGTGLAMNNHAQELVNEMFL